MRAMKSAMRVSVLVCFCIALLLMPSILNAQSSSGLRIEVKDPSGTVMTASGRVTNLDTGAELPFQTDAQGVYSNTSLAPGHYRVEISKAGFTTQDSSIEVLGGKSASLTFTMALSPQASRVTVVGATPLAGTDTPIEDISSPVQTATGHDLDETGSLDLADYMNRKLNGVYINENQVNPFQPDVNYRGYTASPLVGTPEGLSVYMDGVRQNQPFGDIVSWDLIPEIAISQIDLIPGSNPLFGLNSLGGALSITTKGGLSEPGTSVQVSGGSFGRRAVEFEHGGSIARGLNWYVAGNLFHEDGWRQYSPSDVRQSFAKLGWQRENTAVFLSGSYADNELHGNGLQDFRALNRNYKSVYSIPDITWNHAPALNLSVRRDLTSNLSLSGNVYYRFLRADTNNGDVNEETFDESLYNLSNADINALHAAGYTNFPTTGNSTTEPFPFWRCIAQGLEHSEPIEKCTGINTQTRTVQNNYGLSGQASWFASHNHITAGAAWDRSSLHFGQESQFGYLNPDGVTLTLINSFADGTTNQDGDPVDTRVNLHGLINTFSIYGTDTISLNRKLSFTLSARFNHTGLTNADRLPPADPGVRGSLDGQYTFDRFNPAVGLTYTPSHIASTYFSYSEANRAPTSVELGCADPNEPCNLPNALVSDPPLKQVVARTFEVGVRNAGEGRLHWDVDYFHTENYNDLLFVASEQTGFGYFTNFGETRREGIEVSLSQDFKRMALGGDYTFLNATYQSAQTVDGGSNSTNDGGAGLDGNIDIDPGDRIPQIPQHMFKLFADFRPLPKLSVELDLHGVSNSYARGNENNQDHPDGTYYLGPGTSPPYAVVDLGAHYLIVPHVQAFVQIDNLFNTKYYTAAQLGTTPYDSAGHFIPRPFAAVSGDFPLRNTTFYAPGSPIGAFGGLKFSF
jgi:outer membrane receptor protein involved in Fe transport